MNSTRLRFVNVTKATLDGDACRVIVRCTHEGREFTAAREGLATGDAPLGLAAAAALEIVESFTAHHLKCSLEEFERTQAFGRDLIVLLVRLEHSGSRVQLFGSCRVRPDQPELMAASVRAALDATNRYVELARKQSPTDEGAS